MGIQPAICTLISAKESIMRLGLYVLSAGLFAMGLATARAENVLATAPDAPVVSLKTKQLNATAGGQVIVEVYVTNVRDLSTYEMRLNVVGGDRGTLTLEKISVDQQREDYVFKNAGVQILDVVDMSQQRVGMVRFGGGSDVAADKQAYLATFTYRVSGDASGKFAVSLGNPEAAFLNNSQALQIPHRMAGNVEITVGQPTPVRTESRKKG